MRAVGSVHHQDHIARRWRDHRQVAADDAYWPALPGVIADLRVGATSASGSVEPVDRLDALQNPWYAKLCVYPACTSGDISVRVDLVVFRVSHAAYSPGARDRVRLQIVATHQHGDMALQQVANVATLPGIVRASYAMPDVHWGYGFPIGGVAATDVNADGVVSPGGVGFDISCGVRLLVSDLAPVGFSHGARRGESRPRSANFRRIQADAAAYRRAEVAKQRPKGTVTLVSVGDLGGFVG